MICNITGYLAGRAIYDGSASTTAGALTVTSYPSNPISWSYNSTWNTSQGFDIDTSLLSDLFTDDTDTVNPESATCLFCIKYE